MPHAKPVLSFLCLLLLAVPATQAAPGPDLGKRLAGRFDEAVAEAHATEDPARKRAVLDDAFGDMLTALHRIEQAPGLSEQNALRVDGLQRDLRVEQHRLNGTGGFPQVPGAELDRYASNAQQNLDLLNRSLTLSLTTALLILIILILVL